MIYLDNAATTLQKPKAVIKAAHKYNKSLSANPGRSGHKAAFKAAQVVFECRESLRQLFNAKDSENIIFTKNCTEGLNIVIQGILKENEHCVISCFEHNSVLRPVKALEKCGVTFTIADFYEKDEQATKREFENAITPTTKLFICTHASNVFGVLNPIKQLGKLCKEKGILFCVDAAQTAGVVPIDVQGDNIDFLCMPGHKGLYGPMGTGVLILNSEVLPQPLMQGGTGSLSLMQEQPQILPDCYESGTLNVPGIAGLQKGVEFVQKTGVQNILQHEIKLLQIAYDNLSHLHEIKLHTHRPHIDSCSPVLSFSSTLTDSEDFASYLEGEHNIAVRAGLHCSPLAHKKMGTLKQGTVRISPSFFTTQEHIFKFIKAVEAFEHSQ
ncbi:MAG: aminotransferase class V-fold PLP-dependent enzyme [Oscillospiraceae bacterium]|jgi:cysteine desulfurase family protein|nr:aminotransferase class V-fold PLP-dependent enzyme [Oscillospiraceae bacterium]